MRKIIYTCALLYIFFVLQGVYGPANVLFPVSNGEQVSLGDDVCYLSSDESATHTSGIAFLVDDDDDDDDKRRIILLSHKGSIRFNAACFNYYVYDLGKVYSVPKTLFYADASPPRFV